MLQKTFWKYYFLATKHQSIKRKWFQYSQLRSKINEKVFWSYNSLNTLFKLLKCSFYSTVSSKRVGVHTTLLQISSWGRIVHFDIHAHLKIWVHSDSFTNSTYSRNCSLHASRYYCGSSRLYFMHEMGKKGLVKRWGKI